MENLKLVIVGHVDHGKSTLIGRLFYDTGSLPDGKVQEIREICAALGRDFEFGFVMDNLSEERDQSITIDTAQKFFKTGKRRYTIIDAPGHVEFIKNMITGASQADAAILIVDVQEGVREQTRRHAYILGMLGLSQVIVCINKMDKADYAEDRFDEVAGKLSAFLDEINIKPYYIIPACAKDGDNIAEKSGKIPWYTGPTILAALDQFKLSTPPKNKLLRFPVQDVYKFDEKRIITGRITSGTIRPGEEIMVLPSGEKTKVNSIEQWQSDKKNQFGRGKYYHPSSAGAGKSSGVMLEEKLFVDRGDVIVSPADAPRVADSFKAHVFWLDKKPYSSGERLTFKCATQEVMCEIEKIEKIIDSSTLKTISENAKEIKNREVADITLKTAKPVVIENFNKTPELGRFVLERADTCAGGIITEANL
ncbi:MAG: GTP-binding protein [Candidatus Altiarchaeota archaeon]